MTDAQRVLSLVLTLRAIDRGVETTQAVAFAEAAVGTLGWGATGLSGVNIWTALREIGDVGRSYGVDVLTPKGGGG